MGCSRDTQCPYSRAKSTKEVTLTFLREELLYDAGNYSYVTGETIKEEEEHNRHQVFDIVQEGNIDRVTRVLNMAFAECVEMLYPYTKKVIPDGQGALDDILREPGVYKLTLTVPEDFSVTTLYLLEGLIHEYLVCRVVADWMSITYPDKEVTWEKKFALLRDKIRSSITSRTGVLRRKLKPF